jgi:flavin reductase (DIM6/NTAB) family NADH-FMN oxidoreductase RutF
VKRSLRAKTLLYPTPVLVEGTYDVEGRPNVMTAAWGGIACSKPPCVSVSLRSATASHGNIIARKAFTISLLSREQAVHMPAPFLKPANAAFLRRAAGGVPIR